MHMSHIQKTAPGPPRQIAEETPTMLPVPTRDAVETIMAWNEETLPSSWGFSAMSRQDSLNCRICTKRVRAVK